MINRDPRVNPVAGDKLKIHLSDWEVDSVCGEVISLVRGGAYSEIKLCKFRGVFKFAAVVPVDEVVK